MKILMAALLLIMTVTSNGQYARFEKDGTFVIIDGKKRIRLDHVSEPINQVPTVPRVHAVLKGNGGYFIVVTTSRWTRGFPPRDGAGGCGEEASFTWLHVVKGKVVAEVSHLYRSWVGNREGGVDGWSGSVISVSVDDLLEDRLHANDKLHWQEIKYTFDAKNPEAGILVVKGQPKATYIPLSFYLVFSGGAVFFSFC